MHLHGRQLELRADLSRQLRVLDPSGRQLTISCGAALLNARLSLAAAGFDVRVERFPDPLELALMARLTVSGDDRPQKHSCQSLASPAALSMLDHYADTRHSNHHAFTSDDVPDEVLAILSRAVSAEHGEMFVIETREHREAFASLSWHAQADLDADPSYRAEAESWEPTGRRSSSGESGRSGPHREAGDEHASEQCLVVICSSSDSPLDWLRSGEALERMLVETTRQGFVAGPVAQTIVTTTARAALRAGLGLTMTPQIVLRLGRAPVSLASRRRRLVDVLVADG
jgi:hypothetical protein